MINSWQDIQIKRTSYNFGAPIWNWKKKNWQTSTFDNTDFLTINFFLLLISKQRKHISLQYQKQGQHISLQYQKYIYDPLKHLECIFLQKWITAFDLFSKAPLQIRVIHLTRTQNFPKN